MLTALVHVPRTDDGALDLLVETLTALVAGVAAGVIADAVVVVPGCDPEIAAVAEGTGATLVTAAAGSDPWRVGAGVARRDWLLCLVAGDVPGEGWLRAVDRFVGGAGDPAARARLRRRPRTVKDRLDAVLERVVGRAGARAGDVVHRSAILGPGRSRAPVRCLPVLVERADAL